ncbi:MAG TPA: hypothetical protein PL098_02870 [Brevundimonas diminuta]|nr:hypothetical protein [Brevundimonas diminuta]HRL24729.1 hypothetical protein [Brevundimonas diminuta]
MIAQTPSAIRVQGRISIISGPRSDFSRDGRLRHGLGVAVKGVEILELASACGGLQTSGGRLGLRPIKALLGRLQPTRLEVQRIPAQAQPPPDDQQQHARRQHRRPPAERRQNPQETAHHG